tara:strand:- start:56 stop:529 length:474 start_codon:yes stop_codon:yes gene_type:complete
MAFITGGIPVGGNLGAIGGDSIADLFKKRMQEGSAQNAVDMMRRAAEADQQRMGATPGAFLGSQMGNVAGISFDINESPKNRKMRGVRKLAETGVGGEKDAALEILKKTGGPQLPLAMGATSPGYFLGSQMGMGGGLSPMGNLGAMIGGMMGRGLVN